MVNKSIRTRALWFIDQEMERVLGDLESGVINKDQAIGSLNTLFIISSGIEDGRWMRTICTVIGYIRKTNYFYQLRKLYLSNYFDESMNSPSDQKGIN